ALRGSVFISTMRRRFVTMEALPSCAWVRSLRRDLLDTQAPSPFVEKVAFIEHETVIVEPGFKVAKPHPCGRIIEGATLRRDGRKKRGAIPLPARASKHDHDIVPFNLVANDIEKCGAQRGHARICDRNENDKRRESAGLGKLARQPASEISC